MICKSSTFNFIFCIFTIFLEKNNFLKLSIDGKLAGAGIGAAATAKNTGTIKSQNYTFDFNARISNDKTKVESVSAFSFLQSGKTNEKLKGNYFESWYEVSSLLFWDGKNAEQRKTTLTSDLTGSFPVANLTPKFSYEISANQKTIN